MKQIDAGRWPGKFAVGYDVTRMMQPDRLCKFAVGYDVTRMMQSDVSPNKPSRKDR